MPFTFFTFSLIVTGKNGLRRLLLIAVCTSLAIAAWQHACAVDRYVQSHSESLIRVAEIMRNEENDRV
jgi:hypothetical protein